MTFEPWVNKNTSLFDMTDREWPNYIHLVTVRSILMKKGKRAVVTLSAPMPNKWLWDFDITTLEIAHGKCAGPANYRGLKRIIELSNCTEAYRWIDDPVIYTGDVSVIELAIRFECDIKVIFESEQANE
jgi:hypothetical protein